MREIGAIEPADGSSSVEERPPPERKGRRKAPTRPPRKRLTADDLVAVEPHQLDVEA